MSTKGESFQSRAEEARTESQTTQTTCFEYFVSDLCKFDAKTAYENFLNGYQTKSASAEPGKDEQAPQDVTTKILPDQETKDRAEDLIKNLQQHIEDFTKSSLIMKSYEYTKKHEDIVNGFFRDLKLKQPFDETLRNTLHKIQQDPIVSKDAEFIAEFKKQADRLKPKKIREHTFSIAPTQGAIFYINVTPGQFKDSPIKQDKVKESFVESLYGLYQKHVPSGEAPTREEIDIDVSTILLLKRPGVGSNLAYDDVVEVSKLAHEEATKAHHSAQDISRNRTFYKFNKDSAKVLADKVNEQLKQFKKSSKLSRTERVDIVRELIIQLNKENLSQYQKEVIFDNAIQRCREASPIDRLKANGVEVELPLDPSKGSGLSDLVQSFKDKLVKEPTHTFYADLLQKTYENVKRWDMSMGSDLTHERSGIDMEVTGLMKGLRSASVKEAIFEVGEKRKLYIQSKVFHEEIAKIKEESKETKKNSKDAKKEKRNDFEYEVYGTEPPDSMDRDIPNNIRMN